MNCFVEVIHVLHLGVSRMWKDVTSVRLRSTTLKPYRCIYVQWSEPTFAILSAASIRKVTKFVEEVTIQIDSVPFPLYVCNIEGTPF